MALPEGTVTFLRSDIVGSMDLVRSLGARFDQLNAEHQTLVRGIIGECDGAVVRTEGDAFFAVFIDAGAAARAAVGIQTAIAAYDWPEDGALRLRIGLHTGTAIRAGDDYGGFEVNRAARISALGHGGQIILSDATRALVSADLSDGWAIRELGSYHLKGVAEPEAIFQLDAPGLGTDFAPLRDPVTASAHLPSRLTSFIGRERELDALSALLGGTRLLTLTGPGGTGKTTLAVELARRHASDYRDGAWFVDLQAVADPLQVRAEIAHGLDMYDGLVGPAADRLLEFVSDREMLIVIDNFEQVVDAAAEVAELIAASPRSRLIVTSRLPLHLGMEQEYSVTPLDATTDASEAVRLFVERVRRVRPGFEAEGPELETATGICGLLDGLPLAIELTAARAGSLPLNLIEDRLRKHLPLPGSGPRDLPARQRTIDDTVAWSYDLLDPSLQHLLRRLGVFEESFALEQAEVICGPSEEIGTDVLDGLFRLVEHSLLYRVDDAVGGVRFAMLASIRAFALTLLLESGEQSALRERHAAAYGDLADRLAQHVPGPEQGYWLERMDPDEPDLRAAAEWAIEARRVDLAIACAARPWRFWLMTGRLAEGTDLIDRTLAMDGAEAPTRARLTALDAAGSMKYWAGDLQKATSIYEEQLELATQLNDDIGRADALLNLGFAIALTEEAVRGREVRDEAAAIYRQHGDEISLLMLEWGDTLDASLWSDPLEQAAVATALADRLEAVGTSWHTAMALATRGQAAFATGELLAAGEHVVRALRFGLETREFGPATFSVEPFVAILLRADEPFTAAVILGAIERIWLRYGIRPPRPFYELLDIPDPKVTLETALGSDDYAAALAQGQGLSDEQLIDVLEDALAKVRGSDEERSPRT